MIRKLISSDKKDYQQFLTKFKDQYLFYAQPEYLETVLSVSGAQNETLIYEENGEISGVLPLLSKNGAFGKVYNSLPFYGSHGGVISTSDLVSEELYSYVLGKESLGKDTALVMISENPFEPFQMADSILSELTVEDRICQVTPLKDISTENQLLEIFHYKTRNMVRKSLKSGFELVDSIDLFEPMYVLHKANMEAINGTAKPFSFYQSIKENYTYGKDYRILGAKIEGQLAAALLVFYHSGIVDYHTPTINIEYRGLQPNSFLIYQFLLDAVTKGYSYWNWGGTWKTQESLYRFKNRWGAKDLSYRYLIQIENKEILNSNPATLLSDYQFFYTVPFELLTQNK